MKMVFAERTPKMKKPKTPYPEFFLSHSTGRPADG